MSLRDQWIKYDPFMVGFDTFFDRLPLLTEQSKYPPYNIRKNSDVTYLIELAVAGFKEEELDISFEKQVLTVKGNKQLGDDIEDVHYIHRGLAERPFTRQFTLADNVQVKRADLEHGMLTIELEVIIPEHQKRKQIPIGGTVSGPELLTESK